MPALSPSRRSPADRPTTSQRRSSQLDETSDTTMAIASTPSSGPETSGSWPTSTRARPPRPSASSTTRAQLQDRRGPRRRRHDGLDGAGAGARHHDHLRRHHLLSGTTTTSTSSTRPATSTSPSRSSAGCASSTAPWRSSTASPGSSPSPKPYGARPTSYKVPRICFINKMDRTGADFFADVQSIIDRLEANAAGPPDPDRARRRLHGVIDLDRR